MSSHGTQCCPQHGCKYGLDTCTVVMRLEAGLPCELCQAEAADAENLVNQILADANQSGPVLQKVAQQFSRDFAVYLCACNPEGLQEALTQALKSVIVTYTQQVMKHDHTLRRTQTTG